MLFLFLKTIDFRLTCFFKKKNKNKKKKKTMFMFVKIKLKKISFDFKIKKIFNANTNITIFLQICLILGFLVFVKKKDFLKK